MRALGLDIGTKTIGVAVSDELGLTAQAVTTIRRTSKANDLDALARIAEKYEISQLVVGLPINMDGSEGPRAAATRALGALVEARLRIPIVYWDERLTTVEAERTLREVAVRRDRRKELVDQVAAALILQGWLDARAPNTRP